MIDVVDTMYGIAVGGDYGPEPPKDSRQKAEGKRQKEEDERIGDSRQEPVGSRQKAEGRMQNAKGDTLKPWGTGKDFFKYP